MLSEVSIQLLDNLGIVLRVDFQYVAREYRGWTAIMQGDPVDTPALDAGQQS